MDGQQQVRGFSPLRGAKQLRGHGVSLSFRLGGHLSLSAALPRVTYSGFKWLLLGSQPIVSE